MKFSQECYTSNSELQSSILWLGYLIKVCSHRLRMKYLKTLNNFCTQGVLLIALFVFLSKSVEAQNTLKAPFTASWPVGWEVTQLPPPAVKSGKKLSGERIRAFRKDQDKVVAALELTYIARNDEGQAKLEEEFAVSLNAVKESFERENYQVTFGKTLDTPVRGLPARSVEGTVSHAGVTLKQTITMVLSKQYAYSINYSAQEERYVQYRKEFDAFLKSLVLK